MKIVQILAGKIWGGAEQYAIDLGYELKRQGHHVSYFACNVPVVVNSIPRDINPIFLHFKGAFDFASAKVIAKFLSENRDTEVIHIHGTNFVTVAILAKYISHSSAKVILTRHTSRATFISPLLWWAFLHLHKIVFVSNLSKNLWLSVNKWMNKGKCVSILNSIPNDKEDSDTSESLREKYNLKEGTKILLFVGRIVKYKGCEIIIKALGQLNALDFKLIFIGKGKDSYINYLKHLAKQSDIEQKVVFYGFSNNVRSLVKQAYIGIIPSIIKEGCPLTPMEFMKAKKTVITTNNGGQAEYIKNGETGLLIPPNNVTALKQALEKVLKNETLVNELGHEAERQFNRDFSYSSFINRITTIYQS